MKILLVPDKFKGSLTSAEIGNAGSKMAQKLGIDLKVIPMADGGDGSADVLANKLTTDKITIYTYDALMRGILASYLIDVASKTAYIELAKTAGVSLIRKEERNIMEATTYGTGLMISDAIERGVENIYLFIGGSATNDAALGCAQALGFRLINRDFDEVDGNGQNLIKIRKILPSKKTLPKITVVSDVNNIMYGPFGAAHVYAAQKGATPSQILELNRGLENVGLIFDQLRPGTTLAKGGGAAGAFGAGAIALFNADIINGFDYLASVFELEKAISQADLVITGEGCLDIQSFQGKIVGKLIALVKKYEKPIKIICGKVEDQEEVDRCIPKNDVFTISSLAVDEADALKNAEPYLTQLFDKVLKEYLTHRI